MSFSHTHIVNVHKHSQVESQSDDTRGPQLWDDRHRERRQRGKGGFEKEVAANGPFGIIWQVRKESQQCRYGCIPLEAMIQNSASQDTTRGEFGSLPSGEVRSGFFAMGSFLPILGVGSLGIDEHGIRFHPLFPNLGRFGGFQPHGVLWCHQFLMYLGP